MPPLVFSEANFRYCGTMSSGAGQQNASRPPIGKLPSMLFGSQARRGASQ